MGGPIVSDVRGTFEEQVYESSPEICSWEKCGCFCGSQYVLVNHVMQEHIQPQVKIEPGQKLENSIERLPK